MRDPLILDTGRVASTFSSLSFVLLIALAGVTAFSIESVIASLKLYDTVTVF